ncbi:hypothetical protein GLOTRDRAFT_122575 [Gloeophyllum trabeum ATCC 11539]|uniref:Uncharacterized protein n=1 Tax=Gloeophyllum trabeum (strain ATCC 11539 / FP-39264 / Madison 617) TaxID=670483 RepID=S7PY40_GLOTA|nr:uncharacterized protein GLOTRDRAFT_122575 [Gloeophyllum trabeum ATCC 11539]EPQ52546.1 hypothetical protein GLOTRDRAFT_122575 [Gloeophyllum trabeum ATCC 11539]
MNPFGNSTQGGEFYEAADPFLFLGDQERDNLCNSPYIDETVGQEFAAAIAHDEELPLAFVPSFPAPVSGSGYHMPSDYRSNHFDPGHFVSTSPAVAQDNTSGPAHSLSITISSTDKDMAINGWRSDVYQSANISSPDIRFSPPESDFPPNSTFSPSSPHTDPDYFLSPTSSTASSSLAVGMQNMHLADEGSGAPITNCSLGGQRLLQSVSLRVDTEPNKDSSNLAGISAWTHGVYPDPSPSSSRRPTLGHRHSISVPSSQYLAPPTQIIRGVPLHIQVPILALG